MPPPAEVLSYLAQHHGVASRRELTRWLSHSAIDRLVRSGWLVRVHRGVFRVAGSVASPAQEALAAQRRAGEGTKLTGPLVLSLLEVDSFRSSDPFELLLPAGRRVRGEHLPCRKDPTPGGANLRVGPLVCARPTAALVDSGRFLRELGERRLRAGYDAARWRNLVSTQSVLERARLLGPKDPGAAVFLRWFDAGELVPESQGERRLGRLVAGFRPAPEPQVWILRFRIDWYWRLYRFGLEYFGEVDHTTAEARLADTDRFVALQQAGVSLAPVVSADLRDAAEFTAWVRSCLIRRAVSLGLPQPRFGD